MHLRTALLVMTVVITAGLPPVRADWMEPLPKGAPSLFPWDQVTGYWVRSDNKNNLLFLSPEGLLDSTKSKDDSNYYFIGRWKVVRELNPANPDMLATLIVASDERFCSKKEEEYHPHFRLLELRQSKSDKFLTIDISDQYPPSDPLSVTVNKLWSLFAKNAREAKYKFEGYWHHIDEGAAPQWFRDQVSRLVLSGRFACEPAK